jgi:hypothetical protein
MPFYQRLSGASLLVFANKHDIQGSLTEADIREVRAKKPYVTPLTQFFFL